jgi:hypothetical protein
MIWEWASSERDPQPKHRPASRVIRDFDRPGMHFRNFSQDREVETGSLSSCAPTTSKVYFPLQNLGGKTVLRIAKPRP